jgi:GT2 family glycosyltransferase
MVSIIIPVRYRLDLTRVCLDSIRLYTQNYELIVVQEGEDEEITDYLKAQQDVKFLQNKIPKGYAGALNTGITAAEGEIYCFLNNDIVATPNWLSEMLSALKERDRVGLVSPTFWGTGERQSVDWNTDDTRFDWVFEPFSLMGVCYVVPKYVIDEIGIWDEQFNHGGEDFDLVLRIYNADYWLVIARKSFIYHYGGASTRVYWGTDSEKIRKMHLEKINLLIKKHNLDADDVYERLKLKPKPYGQ